MSQQFLLREFRKGVRRFLTSILFEFEDLPWLPRSLKDTITDMIEAANTRLLGFNRKAADEAVRVARALKLTRILELGAGGAPLSREIACQDDTGDIELVPSDLRPHRASYLELAERYPDQVKPCFEPLDFSGELKPDDQALAVFLSTFHHLPEAERLKVLRRLLDLGIPVLIIEALRPNYGSALGCLRAPRASLRLPRLMRDRPGHFRRVFWTWLCPVLPFVFFWDALVSVIRQWSKDDWKSAHTALNADLVGLHIDERGVSEQFVLLYPLRRFNEAAGELHRKAA